MKFFKIFSTLLLAVFIVSCSLIPNSDGNISYVSDDTRPHFLKESLTKKDNGVIVFVHGVTGGTLTTWDNKTGKNFAKMVSEDKVFQNYDVYVYGYDSKFIKRSFSIDEVAIDFFNNLKEHGILEYKEIIFVAHSMGGLVARALLMKFPQEIQSKVEFMHFYSTPSGGAEIANLASLISFNPQFSNMKEMQSDDYLANLTTAWINRGATVPSFCAYEKKDTFGLRIVPFRSAVILCNRIIIPLDANHIEIAKPKNEEDPIYTAFRDSFRVMQEEKKDMLIKEVSTVPIIPSSNPRSVEVNIDLSSNIYLYVALYPGDKVHKLDKSEGFNAIRYRYLDEYNNIQKSCEPGNEFYINGTQKGIAVAPEFVPDCSEVTQPVKTGKGILRIFPNNQIDLPREGPLSLIEKKNIKLNSSSFIQPNICDLLLRNTRHMNCYRTTDDIYILSMQPKFKSGKWNDGNLLKAIKILANVAGQAELQYNAIIHGYASESTLNCKNLFNSLKTWKNNDWMSFEGRSFRITNQKGLNSRQESFTCGDENGVDHKDGNFLLSYARASWAASQLRTFNSNFKITKIEASGADFALSGNDAADRQISIELHPIDSSSLLQIKR